MSELPQFQIYLNGEELEALQGQTIAEVLLANHKLLFRKTRNDVARGAFCGMGVCFECRMKVDGELNVRTCITEATPGCSVEIQTDGQKREQEETK